MCHGMIIFDKGKMMTENELTERIKSCSFVISDYKNCAVVFNDIPEGFSIAAKGLDKDADRIVELARGFSKLVVESETAPQKFYEEIEIDTPFTKWSEYLIDIMEEFRLIETRSKKI